MIDANTKDLLLRLEELYRYLLHTGAEDDRVAEEAALRYAASEGHDQWEAAALGRQLSVCRARAEFAHRVALQLHRVMGDYRRGC